MLRRVTLAGLLCFSTFVLLAIALLLLFVLGISLFDVDLVSEDFGGF